MRKIEKNELRVGLFVLIPVVAIVMIVMLKLGYSLFTSTIDVYLKVDSLSSVKKGTPVMIKGYQIGRVVEAKPVYKPVLHFLATMRISRDIELYEDCTAVIQNQNVLGDPAIEISNPDIRSAPLLNGDVIEGIEYAGLTAILVHLEQLLVRLNLTASEAHSILGESRTNIRAITDGLVGGITSINTILDGSQKDIIETLQTLRKTSATLDEISVELKKHPVKFLFKETK